MALSSVSGGECSAASGDLTARNAWTSGSFIASANQFNFMGTAGNVFELFDVSLTDPQLAVSTEKCIQRQQICARDSHDL
jgi:hypothetical protein